MMRHAISLALFWFLGTTWADDPTANIERWLGARLYGHDNDMAALRTVTIRRVADGYRVNIKNQFNFECDLSFDAWGNPAMLTHCLSLDPPSPICNPDLPDSACAASSGCFRDGPETNPACFESWVVREEQIALRCHTLKTETVCKGGYTLGTTRDFTTPGEITIARKGP